MAGALCDGPNMIRYLLAALCVMQKWLGYKPLLTDKGTEVSSMADSSHLEVLQHGIFTGAGQQLRKFRWLRQVGRPKVTDSLSPGITQSGLWLLQFYNSVRLTQRLQEIVENCWADWTSLRHAQCDRYDLQEKCMSELHLLMCQLSYWHSLLGSEVCVASGILTCRWANFLLVMWWKLILKNNIFFPKCLASPYGASLLESSCAFTL